MNQYKGECLCGACRYVITGKIPKAMYICHCSRCRKETGTAYAANVFFENAQLSWEKGEDKFTSFHLKNTRKQRTFCKICGSSLPRKEGKAHVVLPAGTLDNDNFLEPTAHIFYASRSIWEDKVIESRRYDTFPKEEEG